MRNSICDVLLLVLCVANPASAANDCKDIGTDGVVRDSVPGRLIVRPHDVQQFRELLESGLGALDGEPLDVREIGDTGFFAIDSHVEDTHTIFGRFFPQSGRFATIEPDRAIYGMAIPLEAAFRDGHMWGLTAIEAAAAWDFGTGSTDVVAAVLDSGIDPLHPDLARPTWKIKHPFVLRGARFQVKCRKDDFGFNAIAGNCQAFDHDRHGTRVAGIIGADGENNGAFVVGVNWSVTLLPVAILDRTNTGCASRAAAALEFVRLVKLEGLARVRVVNLSWGMFQPSDMVREELEALSAADVVIVAAAGNGGTDPRAKVLYPAAHKSIPTLISVGATAESGDVASISTRDKEVIDIGAPGVNIRTTEPNRRSVTAIGGTSLATAFVTGAVALIASQCPTLDAVALKELILRSADQKPALQPHFINGRFLNLHAAAKACDALSP